LATEHFAQNYCKTVPIDEVKMKPMPRTLGEEGSGERGHWPGGPEEVG